MAKGLRVRDIEIPDSRPLTLQDEAMAGCCCLDRHSGDIGDDGFIRSGVRRVAHAPGMVPGFGVGPKKVTLSDKCSLK